jgi:hypothetical protein
MERICRNLPAVQAPRLNGENTRRAGAPAKYITRADERHGLTKKMGEAMLRPYIY